MRKVRALLVALAVIGGLIAIPGTAQAANFTLTQTVVGNGSVTSDDTFIDCPGTCTHSYSNVPAPVVVVLTEHPASGATFDHWNGSVCEGDVTVTCQITMSNQRGITATFTDGGGGGTHLVCAGDIARAGGQQVGTSNRVIALNPDAVCTLGDNAYNSGTAAQFNSQYDPSWGRFANITYPSPGNHEYKTSGASGYFGYFNGKWAGGGAVPQYYRATVGAWDIYSLNSEVAHTTASAQVNWLDGELAAHPNACILAYWHQPRWSSGDHGSNASFQPFWNSLQAANADIILNGHDHDYERFAETQGIREFVVGTGGTGLRTFHTPFAPGSEKRILSIGVLDLNLTTTGYDYDFMNAAGTSLDSGSGSC